MPETHDPAQQTALWADELRHISAMGLRFAQDPYDLANYRRLQDIAMEMMALATGSPPAALEPLRAPIFSRPTPLSVGDGAVIRPGAGEGEILLIRRADNGLWAMPGGALDVGETPAAGTVREVREETGLDTEAIALVGIHDSRLCGSTTPHHLYHFLFLCRPLPAPPRPLTYPAEVLDARWFPANALPSDLDPGHASRIPEAFRVWRGDRRPYFDPVAAP